MDLDKRIITRQSFHQSVVAENAQESLTKVQQALGQDVTKMRFGEFMRYYKTNQLGPMSQFISSTLAGTKVLEEIAYGAEYTAHEGRVGRQVARQVDFDDDVVTRLPKYEALGYKAVVDGFVGIPPPDMQAKAGYVEFTVADDSKTHRAAIRITENAIRDCKWNELQNQLFMLGESMGQRENRDIMLGFDTATTTAWDTDIYKTLLNGRFAMKAAGYWADELIVGPTAEALCFNHDKFIHADYLGRAGETLRTGQIGRILGMDVFSCAWVDDIPTEGGKEVIGVIVEKNKGVGFALKDDLYIKDYVDVLAGLEGAVAAIRYDVKIINTAAARQLLAA